MSYVLCNYRKLVDFSSAPYGFKAGRISPRWVLARLLAALDPEAATAAPDELEASIALPVLLGPLAEGGWLPDGEGGSTSVDSTSPGF